MFYLETDSIQNSGFFSLTSEVPTLIRRVFWIPKNQWDSEPLPNHFRNFKVFAFHFLDTCYAFLWFSWLLPYPGLLSFFTHFNGGSQTNVWALHSSYEDVGLHPESKYPPAASRLWWGLTPVIGGFEFPNSCGRSQVIQFGSTRELTFHWTSQKGQETGDRRYISSLILHLITCPEEQLLHTTFLEDPLWLGGYTCWVAAPLAACPEAVMHHAAFICHFLSCFPFTSLPLPWDFIPPPP